jgi:hypothetical protein
MLQLFRDAGKAALQPAPAPKKSRRKQQRGEDDSQRIVFVRKQMRRLFRKVKRHLADEWQDDPTDGSDWWTQHQRQQRTAGRTYSASVGLSRDDLARHHSGLLDHRNG